MSVTSAARGNVVDSFLAGNTAWTDPGAYVSIATTIVGTGGSSTISFTSIPGTYKHLQVRMTVLAGSGGYGNFRINSDSTTSNYYSHGLSGNGSAATAAAYSAAAYSPYGTAGNTSYPYLEIMEILDYANTSKYKTIRQLGGFDSNGGGSIVLSSILWQSTSAITRLDFNCNSGSFSQYSHFALYGVK